jgi:hypothetical protein
MDLPLFCALRRARSLDSVNLTFQLLNGCPRHLQAANKVSGSRNICFETRYSRDQLPNVHARTTQKRSVQLAGRPAKPTAIKAVPLQPERRVSTSLRPLVMEFSEHFHLRLVVC